MIAVAKKEDDRLMTPAQVAEKFGVDAKTVSGWGKKNKLSNVRTIGGHRRYLKSEVDQLAKKVEREI